MALRDWPLWSAATTGRVRITPGSQPLRPSVRAGAPPLGRGGCAPQNLPCQGERDTPQGPGGDRFISLSGYLYYTTDFRFVKTLS